MMKPPTPFFFVGVTTRGDVSFLLDVLLVWGPRRGWSPCFAAACSRDQRRHVRGPHGRRRRG
jgi:hypothetical protein